MCVLLCTVCMLSYFTLQAVRLYLKSCFCDRCDWMKCARGICCLSHHSMQPGDPLFWEARRLRNYYKRLHSCAWAAVISLCGTQMLADRKREEKKNSEAVDVCGFPLRGTGEWPKACGPHLLAARMQWREFFWEHSCLVASIEAHIPHFFLSLASHFLNFTACITLPVHSCYFHKEVVIM